MGSFRTMLTVTVVSTETESSSSLRARLQQSGLVQLVRELAPTGSADVRSGEAAPDVMLLDLVGHEVESYFATAAAWRRRYPSIRIIACAPSQHPDSALLMQAMRCGVQEFLTKPVDPVHLREALVRFAQEREANGFRRQDNLIVVIGAKGGVGTTTITANLGVQLAQASHKRVLLLDLARPLGHLCLMFDLQPRFGVRDAIENLDHLDGHFLNGIVVRHKSGVEVLAGTTHAEQWDSISGEALRRVVSVAQNSSDFIFVDGGVASVVDSSAILQAARAIVVVTAVSVPALWALEHRVADLIAQGVDPARIRVLINRWRRTDDEALQNVEKRMKHSVFARLPNDFQQVNEAESLGTPLSGNHNNALVAKFRQLTCQLAGVSNAPGEKRGLSGFFSFPSKK